MRPSRSLLLASLFTVLLAADSARAQSVSLDAVLDQSSVQISGFLGQVSEVKCTEHVSQLKLDNKSRVEYVENATYDYLVLLQGSADDLLLNESRIPVRHDDQRAHNVPLLVTNGFSTLFLIFHPYYRNSFRFEADGEDVIGGEHLLRVHFAHVAGRRTPAALGVRGREYPLPLAGTAWIDPSNGMVAKIDADLATDMRDVGVRSLSVQVEYAPVKLPGWTQVYRFPVLATIDLETLRQHWRNVHRFSDYKRFVVGTSENVATQAEKP